MNGEIVITFKNTNFAIKGENCLLGNNLPVSVMPLPSQIRGGCGICLRLPEEYLASALKLLDSHDIENSGVYRHKKLNTDNPFEKIR